MWRDDSITITCTKTRARVGRPSVPPHMKSQSAATPQRSKCWISNVEYPGTRRSSKILHRQYCHSSKTRPKSPMSLIVLLPRGTVVRIRENPPHHSQNPSSRVQPSYGGQRFCAHEQAERLSNELARSFAQSSQRSAQTTTKATGVSTVFHMQLSIRYFTLPTSGCERERTPTTHKQGPKLLPESPVMSTND